MKAVRISETSVYCNETTRRHIPEGCHLYTYRRETLNFVRKQPLYLSRNSSQCACLQFHRLVLTVTVVVSLFQSQTSSLTAGLSFLRAFQQPIRSLAFFVSVQLCSAFGVASVASVFIIPEEECLAYLLMCVCLPLITFQINFPVFIKFYM
jgi:hypothetical protein